MPRERILFVTGKLAESALRRVVERTAADAGFDYKVAVLGISVAALMHADWVLRKLDVQGKFDRAVLPGWCDGDLSSLAERHGFPFECGPKDLHDLPTHFGAAARPPVRLDEYDIEIIAEINHAPRLPDAVILARAERFYDDGADVIDLGCVPGESWSRVGEIVRLLCDDGHRVSIDSFDRAEVEAAVAAGAELVLSCHGGNVEWAADLDAELVVIPDDARNLETLARTVAILDDRGARYRLDPVLEPIGFGFASSLARYFEVRRRWPDAQMMMGIGNLTELTEVDSAGVNFLLAGICQELGVRSVLTTEVVNWCRTAVKEFDLARRMVHHAVTRQVLPKHLDDRLAILRDPRVHCFGEEELQGLRAGITDPNFRIFAERGELHVMNRDGYWRGTDPFELFDRILKETRPPDASHAFYLGYELCKALTALTLGKQYTQDEALRWGFLTVPETSAVDRRHRRKGRRK
ncbi:MAG: DUF6513 domain-containing protein [Planctomycetales bacterium]